MNDEDEVYQKDSIELYGRCDECGAPCDGSGCTTDRSHIPGRDAANVFSPEALEAASGKTLPLVFYEEDGTRRQVGAATLRIENDGLGIRGHISDPKMAKKIYGAMNTMDGFSIANQKFEKKSEKKHGG